MIHLRRTVAAVALLVGAAVVPGLVAAPAHAAGCSGASGTTVVVDFAELGGGVTAGCAAVADGTRANAALQAAGYGLTMATRSPGFLCRVNGVPASDPCVEAAPADAYWSVWWADGDGGSWVYSARGIDSLRVPDGGYLALSWHQGKGRSQPPATVPVSREVKAEPAPTKKPAATPTKKASPKAEPTRTSAPKTSAPGATAPAAPAQPSSAATTPATPEATPSETPEASEVPTPEGTPTPGESVAVDPELPSAADITAGPDTVATSAEPESNSLPVWAPVLVLALVAGIGGGYAVTRRRRA